MLDRYLTVKAYGEAELEINRSKFLAYVSPVETEEEAKNFVDSIKTKHRTATHNCSAYIVGENDQYQKADDDGEPSGTAGVPILEVVKKNNLKNTVIVVTRYFGGIKLGAGGLIRAYGKTASCGLQAAGIVEKKLYKQAEIKFDYSLLGRLENELREKGVIIKDIKYLDKVIINFLVNIPDETLIQDLLNNISNGELKLNIIGCQYVDVKISR